MTRWQSDKKTCPNGWVGRAPHHTPWRPHAVPAPIYTQQKNEVAKRDPRKIFPKGQLYHPQMGGCNPIPGMPSQPRPVLRIFLAENGTKHGRSAEEARKKPSGDIRTRPHYAALITPDELRRNAGESALNCRRDQLISAQMYTLCGTKRQVTKTG